MRPTIRINNTRVRRYHEIREGNSGAGYGHPGLPVQFSTNVGLYVANDLSGFYPPHPIESQAFHRSYSAPDHGSLIGYPHAGFVGHSDDGLIGHSDAGIVGHPHAHGGYYPQFNLHSRSATPHAPSPLGLSGQYGLRPNAIPFDPSSPLVDLSSAPSPSNSAFSTFTGGALCLEDCDDDCPFADPYLPGWLERKGNEKDSSLEFLREGGEGASIMQPGWLERMARKRDACQATASINWTDTTSSMGSGHTLWEDLRLVGLRGGELSGFGDLSDYVESPSGALSRSTTLAPSDQQSSTSRFSPRGISNDSGSISRSSTPSIRRQHLPSSQHHAIPSGAQSNTCRQNQITESPRPFNRLVQPLDGNSSEQVREAFKRAQDAKRTVEPTDSPCSSTNNSQQSTWSVEDMAEDVPPEDSCSVFIFDLPKDVTLSKLLGSIRGYGRVRYSKNCSSGALVVFFEREAAQRLAQEGHLMVGGVQGNIRLAKCRIAQSTLPSEFSRVLVITGLTGGLSVAFLKECFEMKNIRYELVKIARVSSGDMSALEFHFASHSQAAKVKEMIATDPYFRKKGTNATYGIDPCAEPSVVGSQEE
ncbi:Putative protein of unknown function [Podospora comata]|uniref:RRM domain-containing protein n=1 Tax=Podospora comata TaxID=48703 RepID=A0ABY6RZE9_PODCO|nr:Putative protein of unknown function [Podospora comata]